ncbi:GntR family transcriptional regulator [Ruania alba]|uniref:GntR family transcriptional regulator n=1 Tax=Ruania alba TaxID=648782 RepID=A0A1H5ENL8_9MICO|nr:GntR family transcriptional regulator [Ruania alba]SED92524.1 GntR family transcriptional regulator [Ruania alba]
MVAARTRRTTLHQKMYQELRSQIDNGSLRDGEQLPTELELAERFDVSRGTARHAVTRLVNEGLVVRTAGRGTFVATRRLTYTARELLGFTEQIRASGRVPSSRVVAVGIIDSEKAAGGGPDLFLSGTKLLSIERVRQANDEPVALERLLLPWPRFAGLRDLDLASVSIYDTLEELFGVRLQIGVFELDIADLDSRQSGLLHEPTGTSSFLMQGTVVDQDEQPIVSVRSLYRRSHYTFRFSIPRGSNPATQFVPPRLVLAPQ